jgi:signal transduction histidine kinase
MRQRGENGQAVKGGRASGRKDRVKARTNTARSTADLQNQVDILTRELKEALERQTATAEVLQVINSSPGDLAPVFETILEKAHSFCGVSHGSLQLYDGEKFRAVAAHGIAEAFANRLRQGFVPGPNHPSQQLLQGGRFAQVPDCAEISDPIVRAAFELGGIRTVLLIPLCKEGSLVGQIAAARRDVSPFTEKEIELLENFAAQAVIAMENARLFNETQEALERQTATADILKVIASSPDNVQPVFQAIADRSNRLVDALSTTVFRLVDGMLHLRAFTPTTPQADAKLQATFPAPLSTFSWGEAIARGDVYRVIDAEQEPERLREVARERGWRSALIVPLLRDGKPIGIIGPTRAEPGPFTEHHVQLMQTFADQAVIAIQNVELFDEVQARTRELSQSLDDLRAAQDRLIQTEKLASLGQLTAGIAHEIKNPLNFVNNFSALSVELTDELNDLLNQAGLAEKTQQEVSELTQLLKSNLEKVVQHGKRADSIVKNMLLHSREGSGEHRSVDLNALVEESLNLAYHGARAEKSGFSVTLTRDFDPDAGAVELYPQEITRALLNLISNGFDAATKRKSEAEDDTFKPTLSAVTKSLGKTVEIRIRDNGTGISPEVRAKMFNPFFTTKPTGEGTGLGLSMTHDIIVKQHGGRIDVETAPGAFTEFIISLPRRNGTVVRASSE